MQAQATPTKNQLHRFRNVAVVVVVFIVGILIGAAGSGGSSVETSTQAVVSTQVSSLVSTTTITVTRLRAGAVLVNYSGSGNGNSPPFTATTSSVSVVVQVMSNATALSGVAWYIFPVNQQLYVANGEVNGQTGSFNFTGYGLKPGSTYYVTIVSANANWQITVDELKG